MIETKVGGIKVATNGRSKVKRGYVIALFAEENCGKTHFCLTGKSKIGCVPLEMKAYPTLEKDAVEMNKEILIPENPMDLIVGIRNVSVKSAHDQQVFYIEHIKKVQDFTFALLEMPDVHTVMIDKFTSLATWIEYSINGVTDKFIK